MIKHPDINMQKDLDNYQFHDKTHDLVHIDWKKDYYLLLLFHLKINNGWSVSKLSDLTRLIETVTAYLILRRVKKDETWDAKNITNRSCNI